MKKKQTEYDKLRAIWYEKLKDEGFEDIEADDDRLKVWSTRFFANHTLEVWQAKAAYYHMAEKFLTEHPFKSELEKTVWEYHTNAIPVRQIAKILKDAGVPKMSWVSVWQLINTLENIMKSYYLTGHTENDKP